MAIPYHRTPEGHTLPFISDRLHSVKGVRVPQRMLYPSLEMIEEKIKAIPAGQPSSLAEIRVALARQHGADSACPVLTQRHVLEIAKVAVERWLRGEREVTPFWRVVDPQKPSADRLPGGRSFLQARHRQERIAPSAR